MGFIFVFVFEDFDEVGRLEDPVEVGRPVLVVFAVEEIRFTSKAESKREFFGAKVGKAGGQHFFSGIGLHQDAGEVGAGGMEDFKKIQSLKIGGRRSSTISFILTILFILVCG